MYIHDVLGGVSSVMGGVLEVVHFDPEVKRKKQVHDKTYNTNKRYTHKRAEI